MEEIIKAEKEYLVNVLHKALIDSEETYLGKCAWGYIKLAKKYWPQEFANGKRMHVHHINFDHTDNRICNLVVLTPSEHKTVHYMFDPKYDEVRKKQSIGVSKAQLGKKRGPHSKEHNKKIGEANTGKKRSDEVKDNLRKYMTGKHIAVVNGKRTWV